MPRAPHFSSRCSAVGASVFERFVPLLRGRPRPPAKLHIGDSDEEPVADLPLTPSFRREHPHWHQYPHTRGTRALREAIVRHHREQHGLDTRSEQVLVTCGGTHALSVITQSIVDPGDEVLVLAPSWPFFRGMVRIAGGVVRELPFYTRLSAFADVAALERAIEDAVDARTVALYVNSPNNPSGVVLDEEQRRAIARVATRHGLWLIADEAYDGMAFDGRAPRPFATVDGAPEQTLGVFTFSKIHRFAGLRLGWLRAPEDAVNVFDRVLVHQVYSASAVAQQMMLEPLRSYAAWAPGVRDELQARRDRFLDALDLALDPPQGTYFCFFDAAPWLSGARDLDALVGELLEADVAVAPGGDFGSDTTSWIRLCFAADHPDRCEGAARRLRQILGG